MSARTKLGSGTYRLSPEQSNMDPYEIEIDGDDLKKAPQSPFPWDTSEEEYNRPPIDGYQFGWIFRDDGSYIHFQRRTMPPPGFLILDSGSYEEV